MGLFRKGKTRITAIFHGIDLVNFSHYREGKTPSCGQINTVGRHFLCPLHKMAEGHIHRPGIILFSCLGGFYANLGSA